MSVINLTIFYKGTRRKFGGRLRFGEIKVRSSYGKQVQFSLKDSSKREKGLDEILIKMKPEDAEILGHLLLVATGSKVKLTSVKF